MQPNQTIAVISLRTQFENLGDWLIAKLLIDQLAAYTTVLLDISDVPCDFYESMLGPSVFVLQSETTLKSCRGIAFYFWASRRQGKTLVFLSPGHFGNLRGKHAVAWSAKCFFQSVISQFTRVRFLRFGASVGSMNILARFATRTYLRRNRLFARDSSFGSLCSTHLADLVTLLSQTKSDVKSRTTPLLISFRNDRGSLTEKHLRLKSWADAIKILSDRLGCKISIAFQVLRDRESCTALRDKLLELNVDCLPIFMIDRSNFIEIYQDAKIVISNRLHVSLTACVLGAYGIAIAGSYDGKLYGAFKKLSIDELVLDESDIGKLSELTLDNNIPARLIDIEQQITLARSELAKSILASIRSEGD